MNPLQSFQTTTRDVEEANASLPVPVSRRSSNRYGSRVGWEGGRLTRENSSWNPQNRSGDYDVRDTRDVLSARGRWLVQNNAWCAAAQRVFLDNIIGQGILTRANVKTPEGKLDDAFNKASDDLYLRWLDYAHPFQEMSYGEMTRIGLASGIEAGNEFYLEVANTDPRSPVPISFIPFEQEQLDTSKDRPLSEGENEIKHGIERDRNGRIVGYHLFTRHPKDMNWAFPGSTESELFPAERVIHAYRRTRPSQTLGVSWFAPIINVIWNAGEYMGSEINAAKQASFIVGMEKRSDSNFARFSDDGDEVDSYGNRIIGMARGIWMRGTPEDSVEILNSQRPNSNATPWLEFMLNMIGAGVGLSYIRLTGDFGKTTFSSSRAADLQDRKVFRPMQDWHGWHVDLEMRLRVTRMAIALGKLPIPAGGVVRFNRDPSRFLAAKTQPPGWGYVDPTKQVSASTAAIKAGLSTWSRELGELGLDRDEIFTELAADQKRAEELGVKLDLDGIPMGIAEEPDDEENPADKSKESQP